MAGPCPSLSCRFDVGSSRSPDVRGAAQPGLGSVPEQIAPRVAVDSACLWQDVSSGSSCRHL